MKFVRLNIVHLIFSLLFIVIFSGSFAEAGFVAGTLVDTPTGLIPIEQLTVGDLVLCRDGADFVPSVIIGVRKQEVTSLVEICANGVVFVADDDQLMYLPQDQCWLRAGSLEVGQAIFARDGAADITSMTQLSVPAQVYKLSVAKYHNFCVTDHGFLAHNFGPFLSFLAGIQKLGFSLD